MYEKVVLRDRGGYIKTVFFLQNRHREPGNGISKWCHIKYVHVAVVTIIQSISWRAVSGFKTQKNQFFLCNFDHLLVPELIIKGWEGLNLARIEEVIVGTANNVKLLACSIRSANSMSFVDMGPYKQMCLVSPAALCILLSLNNSEKHLGVFRCRLLAWCETYIKILKTLEGTDPCANWAGFPTMQFGRFDCYGSWSEVSSTNGAVWACICRVFQNEFYILTVEELFCKVLPVDGRLKGAERFLRAGFSGEFCVLRFVDFWTQSTFYEILAPCLLKLTKAWFICYFFSVSTWVTNVLE